MIWVSLTEIFKALGDHNRLRILSLISQNELCVCMIAEVMDATQPTVSKHLNRLKYAGIIKCRKISQWCFYSVSSSFKNRFESLFGFLCKEWESNEQYGKDMLKLDYLHKTNKCCQQLLNIR